MNVNVPDGLRVSVDDRRLGDRIFDEEFGRRTKRWEAQAVSPLLSILFGRSLWLSTALWMASGSSDAAARSPPKEREGADLDGQEGHRTDRKSTQALALPVYCGRGDRDRGALH